MKKSQSQSEIIWTVQNGKTHGKTPSGITLKISPESEYRWDPDQNLKICFVHLEVLGRSLKWEYLDSIEYSFPLPDENVHPDDVSSPEGEAEAIARAKEYAHYLFLT